MTANYKTVRRMTLHYICKSFQCQTSLKLANSPICFSFCLLGYDISIEVHNEIIASKILVAERAMMVLVVVMASCYG
jgi:hypothetical protein